MMKISPSLLAADFARLDRELAKIEAGGADWLHLDVMDGVFVPNISFGLPVIQSLRPVSRLTFDVHLMIQNPIRYVEAFQKAGADYLTFHLESEGDPGKTIEAIHRAGMKAGISIKPGTPVERLLPYLPGLELVLIMSVEPGFGGQKFMPESLEKIAAVRTAAPDIHISVDGGINGETGALCRKAGADVLVAGSYVFGAENPAAAIARLKGAEDGTQD